PDRRRWKGGDLRSRRRRHGVEWRAASARPVPAQRAAVSRLRARAAPPARWIAAADRSNCSGRRAGVAAHRDRRSRRARSAQPVPGRPPDLSECRPGPPTADRVGALPGNPTSRRRHSRGDQGGNMTMDVYLRGKRIRLDPAQSLGKGGEADVFAVAGRALKIFKTPDHRDYDGLPLEQKAAQERIAIHQRKLRELPAGLPRQAVVPEELVTDRSGRFIVGYAMELVAPAEPLLRYSDPGFRRAGVPATAVVALFRELREAIAAL